MVISYQFGLLFTTIWIVSHFHYSMLCHFEGCTYILYECFCRIDTQKQHCLGKVNSYFKFAQILPNYPFKRLQFFTLQPQQMRVSISSYSHWHWWLTICFNICQYGRRIMVFPWYFMVNLVFMSLIICRVEHFFIYLLNVMFLYLLISGTCRVK